MIEGYIYIYKIFFTGFNTFHEIGVKHFLTWIIILLEKTWFINNLPKSTG